MNLRTLMHPPGDWLDGPSGGRMAGVGVVAVCGLAAYGFSVGYWRSPLMGVYVAVKLPVLVGVTLGANALLNGLMGLLLGSGLGFRQSFFALLSSFALAALILGSLAPVAWMLAWNAPTPESDSAAGAHSGYLLAHTLLIAVAGVAANLHLHGQLTAKAPTRGIAVATLFAWLGGNAFLGAQFSWVLRPFFGSPSLKVQFLRDDPMRGNFYQAVWNALERISGGAAGVWLVILAVLAGLIFSRALRFSSKPKPTKS